VKGRIKMKVNIKCFGDLAKNHSCDHHKSTEVELTEGEKVSKIMDAFGITEEEAKIVFVNHRISDVDKLLKDGDRVSLFPATGGM